MNTTSQPLVKKVVIVGGGTAGWMAAAAMTKIFGKSDMQIQLVESDQIGSIGVGEATIPQINLFNRLLGLDEDEFVKYTHATYKLGIEFVNWTRLGDSYIHSFGTYGANMEGISFHHFWLQQHQAGYPHDLSEFSLEAVAAYQGKFMRPTKQAGNSPLSQIAYAFQFDAILYAQFLRKFAEARGAKRTEGRIVNTILNSESGFVEAVELENGDKIEGDLFVDCSGLRGVLIEQALKTGYDDWREWLPCDRAIAVPCEREGPATPYTTSTAHQAGWQWRIPLQHRTGNGHVYCSEYISDDEAMSVLMNNLEGPALRDPFQLQYITGRRKRAWNKNVVALGLSSGFLEPLESTSIHLIQTGIARLMTYFPTLSFEQADIDEYNRLTRTEFEYVRDFLVLHYRQTERDDSAFWRHCQNLPMTDHLKRKIALYEANGRIYREKDELFTEDSWLAVMHGQGLRPRGHHPVATALGNEVVHERIEGIRSVINASADYMPDHMEFIRENCASDRMKS